MTKFPSNEPNIATSMQILCQNILYSTNFDFSDDFHSLVRFCAERCGAVRNGAVRNGAKNSDFTGAGAVRVEDFGPHPGCGVRIFGPHRTAPHLWYLVGS